MNTLHCDKFWAWFFAALWWPFWKWRQVEILRCQESIQDIIIYLHMKFRWNRTKWNLWGIVAAILKMAPEEIFRCQESIRDIIIYLHMKYCWNRTMLNLCGIVATILKMATGRNFSMSGINIYQHIKFWWYRTMLNFYRPFFMPCFGSHFENAALLL